MIQLSWSIRASTAWDILTGVDLDISPISAVAKDAPKRRIAAITNGKSNEELGVKGQALDHVIVLLLERSGQLQILNYL